MDQAIIPVYLLTGFLGSGKTTLLNVMIEDARSKGLKPAVLLNEVGDVNVESDLIGADIPMAEMLGGCICCSIRGDLSTELVRIVQEHRPDVIWIESTGIAQPLEIIDGVTEASLYVRLELKSIIAVIDSRHLLDRVRMGTGKTFKLMREQISAANVLIMNKSDLIQQEELLELQQLLKTWNPHARCEVTTRAQIRPDWLIREEAFIPTPLPHQHDDSCKHGCECEEAMLHDHVHAVTYYFPRPMDSYAFEALLSRLPEGIYRAKGIVTFTDTTSQFLFQYAYRESDFIRITPQKPLHDVGVFIGEGFSKQQLLQELAAL